MLDVIAGTIFDDREVLSFVVTLFVVVGLVLSASIFFGNKIFRKATATDTVHSFGVGKAVLFGFGLVVILMILFLIIPTQLNDRLWMDKQDSCAEEVGYSSPGDDNAGHATAEQQSKYGNCLNG